MRHRHSLISQPSTLRWTMLLIASLAVLPAVSLAAMTWLAGE